MNMNTRNIAAHINPSTKTYEIVRMVEATALDGVRPTLGRDGEYTLFPATGRDAEHYRWQVKTPACSYPMPFHELQAAAEYMVRRWINA